MKSKVEGWWWRYWWCGCEGGAVGGDEGCVKLSGKRKTKVNMGHVTKKFNPSLHKDMSPFWWSKNRGFFLPPSLLYVPMAPSGQVFFWRHPLVKLELMKCRVNQLYLNIEFCLALIILVCGFGISVLVFMFENFQGRAF